MLQSIYAVNLFSPVIIENEKALRQLGMQCVDHVKESGRQGDHNPVRISNIHTLASRSYIYLCILYVPR